MSFPPRLLALALPVLLAACQPPAPEVVPRLACGAAQASYRLDADPRFGARFVRLGFRASGDSPYFLRLTTPAQAYWFRFAMSNGYGGMTLIPVRDPSRADPAEGAQDLQQTPAELEEFTIIAERLRVYTLDRQLQFLDYPPDPEAGRDDAPPFLLMPEMGNLLWYEPALLNGREGTPREAMPRGLFRLAACDGAPRA